MNKINRIQNLNNTFSNNYSGNNKININKNNELNESSKKFNNSYSNFNTNKNEAKDTKDRVFHEYKGMDGKIYFNEQLLDLANRKYLEDKNKSDNI